MGLLDVVAQAMGGPSNAASGVPGGSSAAVSAVLGMLQNYPGGLGGLVGSFQKGGLGDAVSSWVGNGANQAITPQQAQAGLGGDVLSQLASKLGVSPAIASVVAAQVLPHVVDHLTPTGQVPQGGGSEDMISMGENILKGLLK